MDIDTDEDGLTDWDEVDIECWENVGLISREDNGYINLPTLKQCMDYSDKSYAEEGLGRFISQPTISLMLNDIWVMPISSDPTREDSDGDRIVDRLDPFISNNEELMSNFAFIDKKHNLIGGDAENTGYYIAGNKIYFHIASRNYTGLVGADYDYCLYCQALTKCFESIFND